MLEMLPALAPMPPITAVEGGAVANQEEHKKHMHIRNSCSYIFTSVAIEPSRFVGMETLNF